MPARVLSGRRRRSVMFLLLLLVGSFSGCDLASQLTDRQLDDALRAGGYAAAERARFIRKLKAKIAQGVALRDAPAARRK